MYGVIGTYTMETVLLLYKPNIHGTFPMFGKVHWTSDEC